MTQPNRMPQVGLKPKDLCLMPARVAIALQEAGWWVRQDIIWSKPSPMPESVTDRFTKAHEYLFLLSKLARYYFDQEAVLELAVTGIEEKYDPDTDGLGGADRKTGATTRRFRKPTGGWATGDGSHTAIDHARTAKDQGRHDQGLVDSTKFGRGAGWRDKPGTAPTMRNKRSVWTIASEPYPEAHFATFPCKLIEPCILAGCPLYACASCGRAATDVEVAHGSITKDMRPMSEAVSTEETEPTILQQDVLVQMGSQASQNDEGLHHQHEGLQATVPTRAPDGEQSRVCDGAQNSDGSSAGAAASPDGSGPSSERDQGRQPTRKSTSAAKNKARQIAKATDQDDTMPALRRDDQSVWSCSSCGCDRVRRGIVLDPFLGSGTTAQVAERLGRSWVGCETNPEYIALQANRLQQQNLEL